MQAGGVQASLRRRGYGRRCGARTTCAAFLIRGGVSIGTSGGRKPQFLSTRRLPHVDRSEQGYYPAVLR